MFVTSEFFFQGVVGTVCPVINKADRQLQVIHLSEGMWCGGVHSLLSLVSYTHIICRALNSVVTYLPEVLRAAKQKSTIFVYINMSLA
jgi:hypothetical protein